MSNGTPYQRPLSLVLTLKPGTKQSEVSLPLVEAGKTNILHFAWLIPIGPGKLLLSTVYDGDFDTYLDIFIDANPEGFNEALKVLADAPQPPITDPVNRAAFHEYVRKNDIWSNAPLGSLYSAYPEMTVVKIKRCEQES
jgi:hypothetical protein